MKYIIALSWLALLLALGTTSCKKDCEEPTDPSCRNYDPCFGQTVLTGDFQIKEEIGYGFLRMPYVDSLDTYISGPSDTVVSQNRIHFVALDDADRYEWQVGSDPRTFEGKEFSLNFSYLGHYFSPETLPVKLTVCRDEPQSCYPRDTQAVSVRNMTLVQDPDSRLIGSYEGSSTRWPDSVFQVHIFWKDRYGQPTMSLLGLPKDCRPYNLYSDTLGSTLIPGYKEGFVEEDNPGLTNCAVMQCVLRLSEDNQQLTAQYYLDYERLPSGSGIRFIDEQHVFTGRRID